MSEPTDNQQDMPKPAEAQNVRNAVDARESAPKARAKSAFIAWLALPASMREPKTAREFAAANRVSERTLYRWRVSEEIQKAVRQLANKHARARYADVVGAIIDSAVDGDTTAQKFYFQQFVPQDEQRAPQETEFRILIGGKPAPPMPIGIVDGHVGLIRPDASAGDAQRATLDEKEKRAQ